MKKLIFIFSILWAISANAQNWSLVMPNDTLVYENNNQFFTVWVDSTHVNGIDTTYFMNQISPGLPNGTIPGDSLCDSLFPSTYTFDLLGLYQPQFCGESITKTGIKWTIKFPQKEFVIFPNNQVGESWIFDSITMDSMTVTQIDTAFINSYNVLDSIKSIVFGTQKIIISKNHGIIWNRDIHDPGNKYTLKGVQNLGTGTNIPMGLAFFEFEVGDVFLRWLEWGDSDNHGSKYERKTIIGKQQVGDTLIYSVKNSLKGIVTEKYWPTKYPFLNSYPNTIEPVFRDYYKGIGGTNSDTILGQIYVGKDPNGNVIKGTGLSQSIHNQYYCVKNDTSIASFGFDSGFLAQYQPGFGIIRHTGSFSLYIERMEMIGYIKNGIPHGVLVGVSKINYSNFIHIFPNPTKDYITIKTETLNGTHVLEMYDLQGRVITTKTFESSLKMDVSTQSKGIYIMVIKEKSGIIIYREKMIIR